MFGIGRIKFIFFEKKWRRINSHNTTYAANSFDPNCVTVGQYTYGGINVLTYNNENVLQIGHFCSIAENVKFILSGDHRLDSVSTFPFRVKVMNKDMEGISKGDIIVKDDVWIGYGSVILSGVHIGQGAVIAAGSVVSKNIEPYAIVGGTPAKVIKKRFKQEIIDYLLTLDYNQLNVNMIRKHLTELYMKIDDKSLDEIMDIYEWFPKKEIIIE